MSNKLSVPTRTREANEKASEILTALKRYPEGTTPKTLSRETGINVNTVKGILPQLSGVKKIMRGFYKVVETGDGTLPSDGTLTDWNFHNCVLSCPTDMADFSTSFDWGLVTCSLLASKGKATCRIATDFPLNVSSLSFVAGFFSKIVQSKFEDVVVSTIEFNRDFSNLRLDGVKCLTISSLVEQFKVYQKKQGLRVEHKTRVPFPMENIVDMLQQNPNTIDLHIKFQKQQDALERLSKVSDQNSQLLFKIIDNLKRNRV